MSAEQNRALVRRFFEEVWNRGDMEVADKIVAPGFGCAGGFMPGREAMKLYISAQRTAFPNTHFTLLSMVHEGDKVAVCWAMSGVPIRPGARACTIRNERVETGLSVYRIEAGQIAEAWATSDDLGTMRRLGITTSEDM